MIYIFVHYSLAEKAETMFGSHVKKFVNCTIDGRENNPHIVLRNVSLCSSKYLL